MHENAHSHRLAVELHREISQRGLIPPENAVCSQSGGEGNNVLE